MTARWWEPAGPGVGPDPLDLQLLTPGEDGPADLGQAFLALHRVGAAACETVAATPVADESVLASVLATARSLAAPHARVTVAKATGGDQRYGDLLLRDLLDDAEAAALSLYRTCVAKKVPPSLVAKRVAQVYGVPLAELGGYSALASDPKAGREALTDTADRVLFGYLAKLVADEGVVSKVEISKATLEQTRTVAPMNLEQFLESVQLETSASGGGARGYYGDDPDERDYRGRFARIGAGQPPQRPVGQAAAAATVGPPEVGKPAGRPKLGRQKLGRQKLVRRKLVQPTATGSAPPTRQGQVRAGQTRRSPIRVAGYRQPQTRQQQAIQDLNSPTTIPPAPVGQRGAGTGRVGGSRSSDYGLLDMTVGYAMPFSAMKQLLTVAAAATVDKEPLLVFRANKLEEYAKTDMPNFVREGGARGYYGDDEADESDEHANDRDLTAAMTMARDPVLANQVLPEVDYIDTESLGWAGLDKTSLSNAMVEAKMEFLRKLGVRNRDNEIDNVDHAVSDKYPDKIALIYQPATPGRDPMARGTVRVAEMIIDAEFARGKEQTDRPGETRNIKIDPNLGLGISYTKPPTNVIASQAVKSDEYWVEPHGSIPGYIRHVFYLHYVDERDIPVSKAVATLTRNDPFDMQALLDLPSAGPKEDYYGELPGERDEIGRFAHKPGGPQAEQPVGRPKLGRKKLGRQKLVRGRLPVQQSEPVEQATRAGAERAPGMRQAQERTPAQRQMIQRVAQAASDNPPKPQHSKQELFIDPFYDYMVLDEHKMYSVIKGGEWNDEHNVVELDLQGQNKLLGRFEGVKTKNSTEAGIELATQFENNRLPVVPDSGYYWMQAGLSWSISDPDELSRVTKELHQYLLKNSSVQHLYLTVKKNPEHIGQLKIDVKVNLVSIPVNNLLRVEVHNDGPVELRLEGVKRMHSEDALATLVNGYYEDAQHIVPRTGFEQEIAVPMVRSWALVNTDDR